MRRLMCCCLLCLIMLTFGTRSCFAEGTQALKPFTLSKAAGEPAELSQQDMAQPRQNAKLHGFHWMIGPKAGLEGSDARFNRLLEEIDRNLATNPLITGVYIIYHWRLLEPEAGRFDFSRLDRVIERVNQSGRYYKLALNPGIYSPEWLYQQGCAAFNTVGSNPNREEVYDKPVKIPVPWDPVCQARYFNAIGKIAERYGNDKHFRAVTLTVATFMSPEWHLPRSSEDLVQWRRLEGFPGQLEQTWKEGIDRFGKLFPRQILVLEASSYPLEMKDLGDAVVNHAATHYGGRFAVQINQLTGRFDQSGRPAYDKLLAYRNRYGLGVSIGLQNLKGWEFPKMREQQGTMAMTAYNFVQAGSEYLELWHGDGKNKETCETLQKLIQEGNRLGLEAFKQQLMKEGKYRLPE